MIDVYTYINESIETRQSHFDFSESCIERGGYSTIHKGVLAQFLNSSIPSGKILLCHGCHNAKCSNPRHLYWGTYKENKLDAIKIGQSKNVWINLVNKYGYEEACKMQSRGNKAAGGHARKGKKLSEDHKIKISESIRARIAQLAEARDLNPL